MPRKQSSCQDAVRSTVETFTSQYVHSFHCMWMHASDVNAVPNYCVSFILSAFSSGTRSGLPIPGQADAICENAQVLRGCTVLAARRPWRKCGKPTQSTEAGPHSGCGRL